MAEGTSSSHAEISTENEKVTDINPDHYLFVVALDFGTTYSGYAFNTRTEYIDFKNGKHTMDIQMNQEWRGGGVSLKTPTSILLDKDGKLVAFGNEAEDEFYSEKCERENVMLFRRFKMTLHNEMGINKDLKIADVAGREFPAKTVFTLSIKALADHFKLHLQTKTLLNVISMKDIIWVLTVPAIWTDAAKDFMRKCAVDAGLPNKMLRLCLEPEAASINVQYLPIEKEQKCFTMTKTGTKYMVVDIGGGTADITVHEKMKGGVLRELHQATGGACGGTFVDKEFENRLTDILGERVMQKLRKEKTDTYLDIFREFEIAKRNIKYCDTKVIRMNFPCCTLDELCVEIENKRLKNFFENIDGMRIIGDKLNIDSEIMRQFFQPSIKELIKHMQSIVENPRTDGMSIIVLVGGSADCGLIQEEIRKSFSSLQLIVPSEAGLAVLRGAVMFGHCPSLIGSRILRFTYGTNVFKNFDPEIHDKEKKITIDGQIRCNDCFSTILTAGTEVKIGHTEIRQYSSTSKMKFGVLVKIFCSPKEEVKYTDDEECFELGELVVPFPRNDIEHVRSFPFSVAYNFGDTELKIIATDLATGKQTSCTLKMKEEKIAK